MGLYKNSIKTIELYAANYEYYLTVENQHFISIPTFSKLSNL